ncbi:MAG: hypothetical protein ACMZ7B_09575 [Balneola sp.]
MSGNFKNIIYERLIVLITNILYALLILKTLNEEAISIYGYAAAVVSVISFLNVPFENIFFIREYDNTHFSNLINLTLIKYLMIFSVGILTYMLVGEEIILLFGILIYTLRLAGEGLSNLFIILFSKQNKHNIVKSIRVKASILKVLLLIFLLRSPELLTLLYIEMFFYLSLNFALVWTFNNQFYFKYQLLFNFKPLINELKNYSVWTHLNGVISNYIYKSDPIFLKNVSGLSNISSYVIPLSLANYANLLPMYSSYNFTLLLGKFKGHTTTNYYINTSLGLNYILFAFTLVAYIVFSPIVLKFLIQTELFDPYIYLFLITLGVLIIRAGGGAYYSIINSRNLVKDYTKMVILPMLIISTILYGISAYLYQFYGVASANVINSLIWVYLTYTFIKNKHPYNNYKLIFKLILAKRYIVNEFINRS